MRAQRPQGYLVVCHFVKTNTVHGPKQGGENLANGRTELNYRFNFPMSIPRMSWLDLRAEWLVVSFRSIALHFEPIRSEVAYSNCNMLLPIMISMLAYTCKTMVAEHNVCLPELFCAQFGRTIQDLSAAVGKGGEILGTNSTKTN